MDDKLKNKIVPQDSSGKNRRWMKIIHSALFVFLILFISSTALGLSNQPEKRSLYYFGIPPHQKGQSIDEIRDLYKPMLKWLGDQVGCRFHFIGADTYEEMIKMITEGKVHLAGLGPVPYVVAKQQNPNIKLLLTELRWDKEKKNSIDSYRGDILALKNRADLKSLWDLKGKKFAFVNHHSTCGYRYPNVLMREKGINPDNFFNKFYFLGSHPRVTDAIAAGSVDAGATWDFNWDQAVKKHGDVFKSILKTPPIPNLTIVAHPSLPDYICFKIQKILPTIDPSLLKGLPTTGFVLRPDSFYDGIRSLVE
ncbi:MAG: phosphate/phosphite/phosphonate ABC transporter substrate-binding protein [Desulfobacterales bacterium]|nr:phosphate/phosphite/phosphonate ABC transporter substrate-binding protein [Desulfobacterales bacterium]